MQAQKLKDISDLKAKHEEELKNAGQKAASVQSEKRLDEIQTELSNMKKSYDLLKIENEKMQKAGTGTNPAVNINQTFRLLMQSLQRAQKIIQLVKEGKAN